MVRFGPLLLLLATAFYGGTSLKFLAYYPMFGRSHVNFMGKVVDTLIDAGHEVTVVGPIIEARHGGYGTKKATKIISIPQDDKAKEFENVVMNEMIQNFWDNKAMSDFMKEVWKLVDTWTNACSATLRHEGLMEELRKETYDAAFSEPLDYCGFGIFHALGINKTAITLSIASFEGSFFLTGNPSFPSYVPSQMADHGPVMTFKQRLFNSIPIVIMPFFLNYFTDPFNGIFAKKFGPDFPKIEASQSSLNILANVSFTFLNSDPLIEFPRPITHNIVDIGGISVSSGHQPLNKTWDEIFSRRPMTVLLSFGTVAKSALMPKEYKETIKKTMRKFPDVTFIWKYENPEDNISKGIPNLVESTFVPQNDMLYDPRLSLFITHCGQGSTIEATTAGVPLIVIPVLGDQRRNAQVVKRLGSGIVLEKDQLNGTDALEVALKEIFSNPEYALHAKNVGAMIRDKPFSPRETFVNNMEFLAKYGPLRQLDHYGKQLNFFQYYLIDVFAFIATIVFIVLLVVFLVVRTVVRCFCRVTKMKRE